MALIEKNSKSAFYKGLSSFWIKHFKDSAQLESIYSGAESLFGQVYLDLMEIILSKSLTNMPVFKREDWKMLILQKNQLSFDPAVFSNDTFFATNLELTITADTLTPALDNIFVSFVDVAHVRSGDRPFFPSEGVYNHALTGKSLNANSWTVVVPSNKTIKNAVADAKSRIISNQQIVTLDVGADSVFQYIYDETDITEITLTAAEQAAFVTPDDLATLIETKINRPDVKATIESGYLVIQSEGNSLRVISNNSQSEDLLFIKAFNFLIDTKIDLDIEATALWNYSFYLQLESDGYKAQGAEYRFSIDGTNVTNPVRHAKYILNTIHDPSIIQEEQKDYRVENGFLYFFNNPFLLTNVAFRVIDNEKQLAFWMSDVLYDNTLMYERYGYRFTDKQEASEDYKLFLRGITFYYTNGPNIDSIVSALNLVAGIPVVLENGEIVTNIQPTVITTNANAYEIPPLANPIVTVGQEVNAFDALTDAFIVEDYIISPNWFANLSVPQTLMPGATLEQRKLLETVAVPPIGDPTYVVGNSDVSSAELVTDPIIPYGTGLVPYELSTDAFFLVELPAAGISIPTIIPKEFTSGANLLVDIADILTKATRQVSALPYVSTVLDEDAVFDINGTIITIPEGTYTTILNVLAVITPQLPAGILVRLSADTTRITFLSETGIEISITACSVTSQVNLGIIGRKSFSGISVKADGDLLKFTNVSSESNSLIRVSFINSTAMLAWSMQPFRQGSGDIVGEDGQPNRAYQLYDDILKYNTFRIAFSLQNLTAETDLSELIDVVLSGKPVYTTPIVAPSLLFGAAGPGGATDDIVEANEILITDIPGFTPVDPSIPEHYDTEKFDIGDILFPLSDIGDIRTHYDANFEEADLVKLKDVGVQFPFNSGNSNIKIKSKGNEYYKRHHHQITIGVTNNLNPVETSLFAFPGIYNYGIQTQGTPYPLTNVERVNLGAHNVGVYAAEPTWVGGVYRTELDPRANAMFLMGVTRPDAISDIGFGEGDFLGLNFWPDPGNNGSFSILNVSYGVETPYGLADILWYYNPDFVADNIPNGKDEFDGSSYSFKYKAGNVGKKWFITLPENKLISESLSELASVIGDDKDIFPFDISYIGLNAIWTNLTQVVDYTLHDLREPLTFIGERYQTSHPWQRCAHVGETYYDPILAVTLPYLVNPRDRIVCPSSAFIRTGAIIIGVGTVAQLTIGNTMEIGAQSVYNGGELSTVDTFNVSSAPLGSPFPGVPGTEYLS